MGYAQINTSRRSGHWARGLGDSAAHELVLPQAQATLDDLARRARHGTVTVLCSARDLQHNQAVALKEILGSFARGQGAT
jgi:uncharacterized protein YeaO (DUF488 family)